MARPDLLSTIQFLCEIEPAQIARDELDDEAGDALKALVELGTLVEGERRPTILCPACDSPHPIIIEYAGHGRHRAYCAENGYQAVDRDDLRTYVLNERWIAEAIARCLGSRSIPGSSNSPACVRIGSARFGLHRCELFFARRLSDRPRFDEVVNTITSVAADRPCILVTSTSLDLIPGDPPSRCGLVALEDVLRFDKGEPTVDTAPIEPLLRGERRSKTGSIGLNFSPGYRSARVGDQRYDFTDKQALVVEELHKAWREDNPRRHQTELQGAADTEQRMGQLFRNHRAYGVLIRHDGAGYYWLDL